MIVSVVFGQFAFVIAKSFDVSMEFMNLGIAVFMMVAVVMVAVVGEFVQSVFSVLCLFANFAQFRMIVPVVFGQFAFVIAKSFDVSMEFMNLGIAVFMMVAVVMVAVVGEFV
jgi:hypothetical protein